MSDDSGECFMKPRRKKGASRIRVLMVEDSEDDTLLLVRELKKGGFEPEWERVETPEAMRKALDGSGWDVILADWRMPHFSGMDALEILRASDVDAPFIIVSGEVGEEAAVEAMRAGATDYVMKGNLVRLCATVERGLEEAEARRERERAERSLGESERRFRSLVMNSSDMVTVFAPDGTRLYSSPSTERLLGYDPEAMIEGSAFDLVHPDDAEKVREEFGELAKKPGTGRPFEFRLRHADGAWRANGVLRESVSPEGRLGGVAGMEGGSGGRGGSRVCDRPRRHGAEEGGGGTREAGRHPPRRRVRFGALPRKGGFVGEERGRGSRTARGGDRGGPGLYIRACGWRAVADEAV